MTAEIKPCPFCSSDASCDIVKNNRPDFFVCECNKCRASSMVFPRKEQAIEAWNKRAPQSRVYVGIKLYPEPIPGETFELIYEDEVKNDS